MRRRSVWWLHFQLLYSHFEDHLILTASQYAFRTRQWVDKTVDNGSLETCYHNITFLAVSFHRRSVSCFNFVSINFSDMICEFPLENRVGPYEMRISWVIMCTRAHAVQILMGLHIKRGRPCLFVVFYFLFKQMSSRTMSPCDGANGCRLYCTIPLTYNTNGTQHDTKHGQNRV